jgi:transposase
MAKKRPRAYPNEFRLKIIALARAGSRPEDLAKQFQIGHQTIRNWLKQAELGESAGPDQSALAESEEVARLRKRVKQLEIERDILSKAAAWFARETDSIPSKSSNS